MNKSELRQLIKEQLEEGIFDFLKPYGGKKRVKPEEIRPEGSIYYTFPLDEGEDWYMIYNDVIPGLSDRISVRPNGNLILHGPSVKGKRIKVPSVERALMYLTELYEEKKEAERAEKEVELDKYDEEIMQEYEQELNPDNSAEVDQALQDIGGSLKSELPGLFDMYFDFDASDLQEKLSGEIDSAIWNTYRSYTRPDIYS